MKRMIAVVLVLTIFVAAVAVLAGCGDTGKAEELMKEGDRLSAKMRSLTYSADLDTLALLASLGIEVSETRSAKPVTDEARRQLDVIISNGKKARAEYEKILELNGVEDFKAYADKRISAINSSIKVLDALKGLLADLGDPANTGSTREIAAQWAKDNVSAAADAVKAFLSWREAENIRRDKGLPGSSEPTPETSAPVEDSGS